MNPSNLQADEDIDRSSSRNMGAIASQRAVSNQESPEVPFTSGQRLNLAHVTSSRFFGGPERQMLELARELVVDVDTTFVSFSEDNLSESFLAEVRQAGFEGVKLQYDTPYLVAATRELKHVLNNRSIDVVITHGYKAGLLGLWAGRRLGLPVIAVSRGWTAESRKVRLYEKLDRLVLRRMDAVVAVSHGQAAKVREAGVAPDRITVIHNAIRTERFERTPDPADRQKLLKLFPSPPRLVLGAAGRLSPEKGFDVLIEAARRLRDDHSRGDFGIVLFGDGFLHAELTRQIEEASLGSQFILAGFTRELDRWMPHFDVFVQSSHTEGLPNVLLEAAAAGVPIVATHVGGTSELIDHARTGMLVLPGQANLLAKQLTVVLNDSTLRNMFITLGRTHVEDKFSFRCQASSYQDLFRTLSLFDKINT